MGNNDARDVYGDAVGSTLAIPLHARAFASDVQGLESWNDPQARQAWDGLCRLSAEVGQDPMALVEDDELSLIGSVRRSEGFDAQVRQFAGLHGRIQVVSLGIGLCTQASRLADVDAEWLGLDRDAVCDLRERLLPGDAVRLVRGSVTDRDWLAAVDPAVPTLFIAEGLLMYLTRPQVTQLLVRIADHMQAPARCVADLHHALISAWVPDALARRSSVTKGTGARFHFGATSLDAFAGLAPGWRPAAVEDTMSAISEKAARASKVFRAVTRGHMYALYCIELDR